MNLFVFLPTWDSLYFGMSDNFEVVTFVEMIGLTSAFGISTATVVDGAVEGSPLLLIGTDTTNTFPRLDFVQQIFLNF
jgi:hypothetical protein